MCYWLTEGACCPRPRGHVLRGRQGQHTRPIRADVRGPPSHRLGEALPDVLHSMAARCVIDTLKPDIVHDHTLTGPLAAARFRAA
jgi:hypothetical protein